MLAIVEVAKNGYGMTYFKFCDNGATQDPSLGHAAYRGPH